MLFSEVFRQYLNKVKCTAEELSQVSGVSSSAISRYRSGQRVPAQEHMTKLVEGLADLAQRKPLSEVGAEDVRAAFAGFTAVPNVDYNRFVRNFNSMIDALDLSVSGLSRAMNFDASYLSRIRTGQRRPADFSKFVSDAAQYASRMAPAESIAELIGAPAGTKLSAAERIDGLSAWLSSGDVKRQDSLNVFLRGIDRFDPAVYRKAGIVSEPVQATESPVISVSKDYYGFEAMKQGELDFFRSVCACSPADPVYLCNSIPIEDLIRDKEYMQKWLGAVAMIAAKGTDIHIIHDVDRPHNEMLLGLVSWIPLYMTGRISSYYLNGENNRVYCHTDYVSGPIALSGECIRGFHSEGRYHLSREPEEVRYHQKRSARLFAKAKPLMETYRSDRQEEFLRFESAAAAAGGARHSLLSSPPIYTMPEDVLNDLLAESALDEAEKAHAREYVKSCREMAETILQRDAITDDIRILSEEEFKAQCIHPDLSGRFTGKDLTYSYPAYLRHLEATRRFAETHPNYRMNAAAAASFENIQIRILPGKWVVVSKCSAPAIHFVIKHPKMIRAFEDFCRPAAEQ